jgi:hypothetical protein
MGPFLIYQPIPYGWRKVVVSPNAGYPNREYC